MKLPSVSKSVRLPSELWQKLEDLVEQNAFVDFSDAVRELIDGGLKLIEIKSEINNPDKVRELAESWDSRMNEKNIFDWVHRLSDNQMKAVQGAIDLEKEKRF